MKNIEVLIVEDHAAEADLLKDVLLQLGYQVPAVAASLAEGLEYFYVYQPDISLVDVYLDGKPDGIAFGKEISRRAGTAKPFLFLTGAIETCTFALAKAAKPYNYLIKPFNKPELQYAIELALERYNTEWTASVASYKPTAAFESVLIKRGSTLVKIRLDEIKYIEVDGRYSKMICYDQRFVVQQSLSDLHALLPADQFFRIHRSYVANLKEVVKIDTQSHEIFFKDGNTLFFSHRYLNEFLDVTRVVK